MSKYGRRAQAGGASVRGHCPPPTPYSLEGGSHVFKSQETLLGSQNTRPREGDGYRTPVPSVVRVGPPRRARLSIWEIHGPISSIRSNTLPPTPDTLTRLPVPRPRAPHLSFSSVWWGESLSGSFHIFCPGHPPAIQTKPASSSPILAEL